MNIEVFGGEGEEAWYREKSAVPFQRLEQIVARLEKCAVEAEAARDEIVKMKEEANKKAGQILDRLTSIRATCEEEAKHSEKLLHAASAAYAEACQGHQVVSGAVPQHVHQFFQTMQNLLNIQSMHHQHLVNVKTRYGTLDDISRQNQNELESYHSQVNDALLMALNACRNACNQGGYGMTDASCGMPNASWG